jgi:hypothetical protein
VTNIEFEVQFIEVDFYSQLCWELKLNLVRYTEFFSCRLSFIVFLISVAEPNVHLMQQ